MKPAKNQILVYTSNSSGGCADCLDVPQDQSVDMLFRETMPGQRPEDFLIHVNRQAASPDTVLQDGDRVTITPLKIEEAKT